MWFCLHLLLFIVKDEVSIRGQSISGIDKNERDHSLLNSHNLNVVEPKQSLIDLKITNEGCKDQSCP